MFTVEKTHHFSSDLQRLQIVIRGAVQGVGFRPFIYRLATELNLVGWVNNSAAGVTIEVEGKAADLEAFLLRIEPEKPSLSIIQSLETAWLDPTGYEEFQIRASVAGEKTAVVLPDIATCPDCRQEIFELSNRRDRYPFTNCTNCGPRYSIIEALPYDRVNTTMAHFQMCPACQQEYKNPRDRRFHAQPNACPKCGPHLELWQPTGEVLATHQNAFDQAVAAILSGKILAIKGLGGFHLVVDARNAAAVAALRQRKHRSEKPFALMYPSLELIQQHCEVSALEARLLQSPEAPIVLLKQKKSLENSTLNLAPCAAVAPGNPYLGILLPYTPLHHLLMAQLQIPIVATSGNLSDEPICIDEQEALDRLNNIADLFLIHNRPILRPVDDAIARLVAGREIVLRRARGYAPLPIFIQTHSFIFTPPILAVGGHLKNTIAIALKNQVFLSQHIGDLETPQAFASFQNVIHSLQQLYDCQPELVACDAHPNYQSTQFAHQLGLPVIPVQHHYAHVLAAMAENQLLEKSVLGIAWDGTGYGLDGTIWGGEFFHITPQSCDRIAFLRPFPLAGGDRAVKEPRRVGLGLLYELFGEQLFSGNMHPCIEEFLAAFSPQELKLLKIMLLRQINTPKTSSMGRLFDGIAAIANVRQQVSFEGQAAMELEFALDAIATEASYPFTWKNGKPRLAIHPPTHAQKPQPAMVIDWVPMVLEILKDLRDRVPISLISAKFHNTLVEMIIAVAQFIGEERIVLTGGCFQNQYLTERAIARLRTENFSPYWHQRIPPNDGGIALGQVIAAWRHLSMQHQG